jgi:hypothetical protein
LLSDVPFQSSRRRVPVHNVLQQLLSVPWLVLATIHLAKGKEYDGVVLQDVSTGKLPHHHALEEQRSLVYGFWPANIPVIEVDPAYTSQTCSRCGSIHKPDGKRLKCLTCGHNHHRDADSGFVIAQRGLKVLSDGSSSDLSVSELRPIGVAQAENLEMTYVYN